MLQEKSLTEQESLRLITEMIQKAKKGNFHESGHSAILWGIVVAVAGFMSFADRLLNLDTGFDWWLLALFALVPQVFISIREKKMKLVRTHEAMAINTVWIVYGISIFALVGYMNLVPGASMRLLEQEGISLFQKNNVTGEIKPFRLFVISSASLLLLVFAFPTMVTGIVRKCQPMLAGAVICYILFVISVFTSATWDMMLCGLAGIFNWLIPGLYLRRQFIQSTKPVHV
jgi:hypothetical protein